MAIYLILGHRDPDHINLLIQTLSPSQVILHVDKKSELRKKIHRVNESNNLIIIDRDSSVNVQWGGFSQIRAMWLLMEEALRHLAPKEKIIFMSGSDFPIKSALDIERHLKNFEDTEFLKYFFLDSSENDLARWEKYHRWDWRVFKSRGSILFKTNTLFIKFITTLETLIKGKKSRPNWPIAMGSQWFSISRECLLELMNLRTQEFDSFFETTFAPDELYFATLFSISKFARNNIEGGSFSTESGKSRIWQASNLTYVDMSLNHFLDISDLSTLSDSNFLYARKFDSRISKDLLAHIKS